MEFGPYRIVRRLASGGMGEVFLATLERDGGFQKEVAVKSVHPKYMADPRFIEFFEREARLAALLNHRHIVQIFDFGRDENRVWLAMEYVDGVDLKTVMNCVKGPLPLRICLDVVQAVARALHYAHRATDSRGKRLEIVHRDISPQNILLSFEGDVKVADFGLAHAAALGPDKDRSLKGKYAYMSPEQVNGTPIDARTDQFSLGIVLYEILTGERAFHDSEGVSATLAKVQTGEPGLGFEDLREKVPAVVAEVVERALDVNRMRRFPDLGHLVDALRAANSELSSSVPSMDLSEWLRQLFPNRKVVPSTTTVEATRTALAEEPIVVRSEVPAPVNMSTGELKEFGDATTGSHRSQLARDYVSKQAKKDSEQRASWLSPVWSRGSIVIVLASAVLTSFALSLISLPDSSESESVTVQSPASIKPASQELSTNPVKPVGAPDAFLGEEVIDALVNETDMLLKPDASPSRLDKTPVASTAVKSRSRISTGLAKQPVKSRVPRSPSPGRKLASSSMVTKKTKLPNTASVIPDAGIASNTSDADLVDAAKLVEKNSDKSQEAATKNVIQVPSILLKVPGVVVVTRARTLSAGRYQISDQGDLFKLTIEGVKLFLRLSAPRGRFLLSANANPWANIEVDGRKLGGTPLAAFPLTPGSHKLLFSTAKGKQVALSFNLVR